MLFILLTESTHYSPEYHAKILFNNDEFNGDEATVCIGWLKDLKTPIKLKNGSTVSLQALLKGFPASPGMSKSLLFQHVEPNATGVVAMAVYQKSDQFYIDKQKRSLKTEIWRVKTDGEEANVFQNESEGMWFGGVFKNKGGKLLSSQPPTRESINYASKVNKLLASPPKKRPNSSQHTTPSHMNNPIKNPIPSVSTQAVPNTVNPITNSWQTPNTSEMITQQSLTALAPFWQQVEEAFHKQNAVNETFNTRIIHLEETTEGMDKKIDQLLEDLLPAARKTTRITENVHCNA